MFKPEQSLFHPLPNSSEVELPKAFTFPFYYQPHPLCVSAANELKSYLEQQTDFDHNFGLDPKQKGLQIGKMFGVMVVQTREGQLGYLAGFSGKLAESNALKGFVPPLFDTLDKQGFYKKGETYLNTLNAHIESLEESANLRAAKAHLTMVEQKGMAAIDTFKIQAKTEKHKRQQKRLEGKQKLSDEDFSQLLEQLKMESIRSAIALKDLKKRYKTTLSEAESELQKAMESLVALKIERKTLSAQLQRQIHKKYRFLNAKGEIKDLLSIFESHPPAGAGECAAPKLFQYAYENNLKPIAMAEFWWGASPKSEVRRHGQFYPSCRSKCEPILGHMMQGLYVAPNPMDKLTVFKGELDVVYEDDYLLVLNKPHEFLSVPGKKIKDSVLTRMQDYLPNAIGPLLVHRLDMSTSGLLVVAKNAKTHKKLQKQFIERSITKRYVALLNGEVQFKKGTISLPLRVDLDNRPQQLVCYTYGKPAKTQYEVVAIADGKTRIHFYPITGRTHQLRVHAAHQLGLHTPIVGDDLYGTLQDRLYLHAEYLKFQHPVYLTDIEITCKAPF